MARRVLVQTGKLPPHESDFEQLKAMMATDILAKARSAATAQADRLRLYRYFAQVPTSEVEQRIMLRNAIAILSL